MITDTQIKTFIAPKLKKVRAKGLKVMFNSYDEVVLANETHGIKLSTMSDIQGQYEYWLTADYLAVWKPHMTLDQLIKSFTVILGIDEMEKLTK